MKRVVITGMGVVSPLGNDVNSTWESCVSGKSGITEITRFDTQGFRTRIAGEVKSFQPSPLIPPKDVKKMDAFTHYSISATEEALGDAGLTISKEIAEEVGVALGIGIGGIGSIEDNQTTLLNKGNTKVSPFFIPRALINLASGQISILFGAKSYNACSVSACASSNHAIGDAMWLIKRGEAKVMIAGGAEGGITPLAISGFSSMKTLSTRNDEPTKASRPFDQDRDGFVFSEGAGVLILEELEFAKKRGAHIYAELVGYGFSSDAYHMTTPSPDGMRRSIQKAIQNAGVAPEAVDYYNAHATSTPIGDKIELDAIQQVFGAHARQTLSISSTKSTSGHLLGAAGALEAIVSIKALNHNIVPPTMNLENADLDCQLDLTPNVAKEKKLRFALSNGAGFGGTNATLAFKAFEN